MSVASATGGDIYFAKGTCVSVTRLMADISPAKREKIPFFPEGGLLPVRNSRPAEPGGGILWATHLLSGPHGRARLCPGELLDSWEDFFGLGLLGLLGSSVLGTGFPRGPL